METKEERTRETQGQKVLRYLETYQTITPHEALQNFAIMRLASVVFVLKQDLERKGGTIETTLVKSRNKFNEPVVYASYRLVKSLQTLEEDVFSF